MHDPYIMFKYLVDGTEHRQRLYDSLRKQGRVIADGREECARELIVALLPFAKSNITPDLKAEADKFLSRPQILRQIMSSFGVTADQILDDDLQRSSNLVPLSSCLPRFSGPPFYHKLMRILVASALEILL
jgi:hypothetical protein